MEQVLENLMETENGTALDKARLKQKIETKMVKYFQNKDIIKERSEENKLLLEDIDQYFKDLSEEEVVIELPQNAGFAKVGNRITIKEVLDKDALAIVLKMDKKELKTPFDFSVLTKKEILTPKMISEHTYTETIVKTKLSKTKRKPKTKR